MFDNPNLSKKYQGIGTNENSSRALSSLFKSRIFDYPKPIELVKYFSRMVTNEADFILDFFSGSATTAHAVMQLNAEDGGYRRHIQVQLPEPSDPKSEANKMGYKTVSEIGKERIRRSGKKILEENPNLKGELDIGFKVFTLDSSNIKTWSTNPEDLEKNLSDPETIKPDRNPEDVLYEILLKYGLDLSEPVLERKYEGEPIYSLGAGSLMICLGHNITRHTAQDMLDWAKEQDALLESIRMVFRDSGFTSDVEKTNALQLLKSEGVVDVKSI